MEPMEIHLLFVCNVHEREWNNAYFLSDVKYMKPLLLFDWENLLSENMESK